MFQSVLCFTAAFSIAAFPSLIQARQDPFAYTCEGGLCLNENDPFRVTWNVRTKYCTHDPRQAASGYCEIKWGFFTDDHQLRFRRIASCTYDTESCSFAHDFNRMFRVTFDKRAITSTLHAKAGVLKRYTVKFVVVKTSNRDGACIVHFNNASTCLARARTRNFSRSEGHLSVTSFSLCVIALVLLTVHVI